MNREEIYKRFDRARNYQDEKWGDCTENPHEIPGWIAIIRGELAKAEAQWLSGEDDNKALFRIMTAGASAVACLEQYGLKDITDSK